VGFIFCQPEAGGLNAHVLLGHDILTQMSKLYIVK
jgi:hypothetical protein